MFDSPDMKITLNAITLPLLEAIVTRNTGHGIDFSRGNGFDQKDSNYIIIRYLDSGFFLEKTVQHLQNGRKLLLKEQQNLITM